jgi:hypothetical protein
VVEKDDAAAALVTLVALEADGAETLVSTFTLSVFCSKREAVYSDTPDAVLVTEVILTLQVEQEADTADNMEADRADTTLVLRAPLTNALEGRPVRASVIGTTLEVLEVHEEEEHA